MEFTFINKEKELLPYILKEEDKNAIAEIWKMYNPLIGPIIKIATYYGTIRQCPVNIGHCEYYDLDDVLRKIMGVPSINLNIKQSLFAGAKGYTLDEMCIGSMAETIERIVGSLIFFDKIPEIIYGSYNNLISEGLNCVSPEELHLFCKEQYEKSDFIYKPFTKDSFLGWIKGKRLVSQKDVYMPAQLVLLLYMRDPKEEVIGYSTTGGLDCHINEYEAIYHGICELVERDAVNLRWFCKIPPLKIKFNKEELGLNEFLNPFDDFSKSAEKIDFYYHSLDILEISVITGIEIDRRFAKYMYYPGGGADINIKKALIKALNEFTQAERTLKLSLLLPESYFNYQVSQIFNVKVDDPIKKLTSFFKVVGYYGYKENIGKLDWYLDTAEEISLNAIPSVDLKDSKEKCDFVLNIMKKNNIDPIYFDFTPKFFKQLKLIKIFTPELVLPHLPILPYMGHPRYYELPKKMGYRKDNLNYADLTKDPLPYP